MFGLFKPKMTVIELAGISARVTYKVGASNASATFESMKANFVAAGADMDSINLELAAFNLFCFWAGAARALQRGKLSENKFDELIMSLDGQLRQIANGSPVDLDCLAIYGMPFADFAAERLSTFCSLTQDRPMQSVLSAIIDNFCKFLAKEAPSEELRLMVHHLYLQTEGTCYDQIVGTKLL